MELQPKLPIETLIENLKTQVFNDGWLFKDNIDSYPDDSKALITEKIVSSSIIIFKYYTCIMLCGDYCFLEDTKAGIKRLEEYLQEILDKIEKEIENEQLRNELQNFFQIHVSSPFNQIIKDNYFYLSRDLNDQLSIFHKKELFRARKRSEKLILDQETIKNYSFLFLTASKITRTEHFKYQLEEQTIRDFVIYRTQLERLSVDSKDAYIVEGLIVKTDYLIKKLLYRFNEVSESQGGKLVYSIDEDDIEVDLENIDIVDGLSQWDELINIHYGFVSDYKNKQRGRVRVLKEKPEDDYSYQDLHGLIKLSKDDWQDSFELDRVNKIIEKNSNAEFPFNLFAKKITKSYIHNNSVSLKCESVNLSQGEFNRIYDDIKRCQHNDEIRNYFPWQKLATKINRRIGDILKILLSSDSNIEKKEQFMEYQNLKALLAKTIVKLEESFKWSEEKSLIPFQSPFNECFSLYNINSEFGNFKLFSFSSYILPISYNRVRDELLALKQSNINHESVTLVYENLYSVVNKANELSDNLKEQEENIRKQERRSVEILAIFSAVALFSIGTIQIFPKDATTLGDPFIVYRFIIAFGYSLSVFVFLIWIITRENIKQIRRYHWVVLAVFALVSFIVLGYFNGTLDSLID